MKNLLIVTALIELGAAVALMAVPSPVVKLLLGTPLDAPAAVALGRLAGAALFALGAACWLVRNDATGRGTRALAAAMLFYNLAAVSVLAAAGIGAKLVGLALWPAVVLHAAMAGWCLVGLLKRASTKPMGTPRMTNS
jgi:hypothetical protein